MNTSEINGSAWALKYYFIAAIPLAVFTVLLPFIILPTFNFVSRNLSTHSKLRGLLHWSWIVITLVLNLCGDIARVIDQSESLWSESVYLGLAQLECIVAMSYLVNFVMSLRKVYLSEQHAFMWKMKWWLLFYALVCGSFLASYFTYPFLELPPYLIYPFIVWNRQRRKHSKGKEL